MQKNQLNNYVKKACSRIAPAWPLENSVAVNPFLGFSEQSFEQTSKILQERGGIQMYMPLKFYLDLYEKEVVTNEDIAKVLRRRNAGVSPREVVVDAKACLYDVMAVKRPSLTRFVTENTALNSLDIMVDHLSGWMSAYAQQLEWKELNGIEMYQHWKSDAQKDLYPELHGLQGFREAISEVSDDPESAIAMILGQLEVSEAEAEEYMHAVLLEVLGWASYCAGLDWQNKLYSGDVHYLQAFLAMRLCWEYAVLKLKGDYFKDWKITRSESIAETMTSDKTRALKAIFQDAYDAAQQRELVQKFVSAANRTASNEKRALAQMVFCIDVRSEVYRRNLEGVNPNIETLGFAGFFGFPVKYMPMNHTTGKNQCPVLISAGPAVTETTESPEAHEKERTKRRETSRLRTSWARFRSGSVSSFSFVSPLGSLYLPKLISDSFGWTRPIADPKEQEFGSLLNGKGKLDLSSIAFEDQLSMAKSALTGMGLTKNFAPFVLISGHGAASANNPHASGLDCGACGGNSGEINALTAQLILNNPDIRKELKVAGIEIPEDTVFVACLHNTTTDDIVFIDLSALSQTQLEAFEEVKSSLEHASQRARVERSLRFEEEAQNNETAVLQRAKDWSQVRPEWGLAGSSAFVVAPRKRTLGIDLGGKSFLHSYDWRSDEGFAVLEAIMTAPMVVTSWINLQYYASSVDNERLGAGNKTLHNVTAGIGVLEGTQGDLRIGLPLQSVFDGEKFQHQPLRLNVVIEAPIEAINTILDKHGTIKDLCDNQWINLLVMDASGTIQQRYAGNGAWEALDIVETEVREKEEEMVEA